MEISSYLSEHAVGIGIVVASVLLTGAAVAWRAVEYRRRWSGRRVGGKDVRVGEGVVLSSALVRDLAEAIDAIRETYWTTFHRWGRNGEAVTDLLDFSVEVVRPGNVRTPTVPAGRLRDGAVVGGSIRVERALPWTAPRYVAVVTDERAGAFLIHEVVRHLTPLHRGQSADPLHVLDLYADLEAQAKRRYAEAAR